MRKAVALEFVVQIGMRIEVNNIQLAMLLGDGADDRKRDGVIAAERYQVREFSQLLRDKGFDSVYGVNREFT